MKNKHPSTKVDYNSAFDQLLANGKAIDIDSLNSNFQVGASTVKSHLKKYFALHPERITQVIGFYPAPETIISLAEKRCGKTNGQNLFEINQACKDIVDSITKPKHQQFVDAFLGEHLEADGKTARLEKSLLFNFIYEEYCNFVHESGNGLVSIAGSLNEKILIQGLVNAGLELDKDLKKTGTNSDADLQVEHRGNTTKIMYCEVKSYAARERLLRGLQDIQQPDKIGVGFFNNASEFNPERTQTLLKARPLAIYMPDVTLAKVSADSKSQLTSAQDRLYRPLSMFIDDMLSYRDTGAIRKYK